MNSVPVIDGEIARERPEEGSNESSPGCGGVFGMSKGKTQPTGNPS